MAGQDPHRNLARAFYAHVGQDSVLRPLYGGKGSFECATTVLADYFAEFFGPSGHSRRHWWLSLRESHAHFRIGPEHREAWLRDMRRALDDCGTPEPAHSAYLRFFEHSSEWILTGDESVLARELDTADAEIAWRWDGLRLLETAVAASGKGDFERVRALAADPCLRRYFEHDRASYLGLLALLSRTPLQDFVREQIAADPGIAREYHGRTLLHDVAAAGSAAIVEQLLGLGADPDARSVAGHTPLYCVGNAARDGNGAEVVRLLAAGGADLNLQDNAKRCTALHMAARRGNVGVAEALLDCGADIESRDIAGETPLRRAVNCRKQEVVDLLLSRGADPHSRDKKGVTPTMKQRPRR